MIKDVIAILEETKAKDFKLGWSNVQKENVTITFTRKTDFVSFLRQYNFSYKKSHIKQICTKEFKVLLEYD